MNEQTKKPWVGKLYHSKTDEDDWGMIRDESEDVIIRVKIPPALLNQDTLHEHRLNNTDPTQERVDAILALLNREDITTADLPSLSSLEDHVKKLRDVIEVTLQYVHPESVVADMFREVLAYTRKP